MHDAIAVTDVETSPIAVVRDRVSLRDLPAFVPAACGEVWSFVRSGNLSRPGRHVALYLDSGVVEVGVELPEPFVGTDRVHPSRLPAGRVATATHIGPYARLGETHDAIREWCAANGFQVSGTCWEIYGHWDPSWNADPSRIRTDVFHLLVPDTDRRAPSSNRQ